MSKTILSILARDKVILSMAEGRRLINNGAVKLNGDKVKEDKPVNFGDVIHLGKKTKVVFNKIKE